MSSAEQLLRFERAIAACGDEAALSRLAVEQAAGALAAPLAAFVRDDEVVAIGGGAPGTLPDELLLTVAATPDGTVELPGHGPCAVERALIDGASGGRLVVARPGEPFTREESAVLAGMARALGRPLAMARLVAHGRAVREDTARESTDGASLTRYRDAFHQSASGMAIEALDGRVLHVNQAACDLFAAPQEAIVGRSTLTRLHRDDRADAEVARRRVIEGEAQGIVAERRLIGAGGSVRFILESLAAVRAEHGEVAEVVVQYQDITERQLAENALRVSQQALSESQGRYQELVEHLPIATYMTMPLSAGGAIDLYYMSPQIEALAGFPAERWLEPGFWRAHIHPGDRAAVDLALRPVARGERCSAEYRLMRASGDSVWVRNEVQPIRTPDGGLHVQGFIVDIGDRVRAERERDQLERELRLAQKLEAVGQLGAGLAHEIGTPVQRAGEGVRALQEALGDLLGLCSEYRAVLEAAGPDLAPELRERARAAEAAADAAGVADRGPVAGERALDALHRVASIVAAVREYAAAPTTDTELLDLNETIRRTLVVGDHEYKYVADVVTDLTELPPLHGNPGRLQQVILQLLVNAAQAIAESGADRGRIEVSTAVDRGDVVLTVSDTGCGIPDEARERIFDPFFTTRADGGATGQGLAIAHRVVTTEHHGTIAVDSVPGRGTTFTVRLPRG